MFVLVCCINFAGKLFHASSFASDLILLAVDTLPEGKTSVHHYLKDVVLLFLQFRY